MASRRRSIPTTVLVLAPEHRSEVLRHSPEALALDERIARERPAQLQ